ncbi:unnamed protein product [Mytilus coruscus]|uniref:Uncharacterized protein n=1 Tax=Mytilus coruscus TaxID=42192 RepID=A0A6J8DP65_MYTCO|nr:unnamed protein product [Mytilus coruscus]
MFVGGHGLNVFGASRQQNVPSTVTTLHRHRGSMTKLQFLGSLVEDAQKKKQADSKRHVKGILKNAISMPNLAENSNNPKIDHKQLRNVIKRQKLGSKDYIPQRAVKKTVKFNDPVGRLGQIESKYKLCSEINTDESTIRKQKKIQQISLRNAHNDDKQDSSNVLVTVVYDLKLKDNKLITNKDSTKSNNDNQKPEIHADNDHSEMYSPEVTPNKLSDGASARDSIDYGHAQNGDTFLSHTVIAPVLSPTEKEKLNNIGNQYLKQTSPTEESSSLKQSVAKPKDSVVVMRSRAKPVMFTRCVNNSIPIADDPVHNTTNFCDEEKTSHIMQWLNDVKNEQERDGFCTLLISDGEIKY